MGLFDNATYLIFDKNGEIIENKKHEDHCFIEGSYVISLGLQGVEITRSMDYPIVEPQMFVTSGNSMFDGYNVRVKHGDIGGEEYRLISVTGRNNFRASGIVYKNTLDSIGWSFFFEFAKFFLPEREPRCCCKGHYNKVLLPYVNKVMQSMVKHFKLEEYYGNNEWTKDMVLRTKESV